MSIIKLTGKFSGIEAETIKNRLGLLPGGKVQMFVALEVIRKMNPYTPLETGALSRSSTTVDGTKVTQITPYAARHYYNTGGVDSLGRHYGPATFQGAPMRGSYWFERMKNEGGKEAILVGTAELAGARTK